MLPSRYLKLDNQPKCDWTVLLVDDKSDNLTVANAVLTYFGAQVYMAESGAQALNLLRSLTPTVILLDLRMPAMDGWETYRLLRENPRTNMIPVIAVTAYAMEGDRQQILDAGFDGYIAKPYDVFLLVDDIRAILTHTASKE